LRSSCRANFLSENQKSDNETRFKQLFPFFALVALEEGFEKPFDVLVVDECQDLLIPEYLDVFHVLVSGGLGNGRWAFFGDMFLQNIFNTGMSSDQMLDELGKRSPGYVKFRLSANCRNTRNIGRDTCRILGFKDLPYRPQAPSGSPVEYFYYKDPTEQTEIVADIIRELQTQEIRRDDITVLCRRRFENSSLGDNTTQGYLKFCELVAGATAGNDDYGINFCTIQSFKGMENSAIIVTDIFELDSAYNRSIIYVAMSRALIKLFVLLPKSLKKRVQMALNS
jgi:superfamily I DNA and RNA helicase